MTISPAETTHDERVGSTLYASIWLIFLAFPVVGLLRSAHGPAAMAVGVGLLLLFAVVYVLSWWEPGALSRLPRIPATLMWLFGLTLCLALLTPLLGGSVLGCFPFLVALLAFRLPSVRARVMWILVLDALTAALLIWVWPQHLFWAVPVIAMSSVLMAVLASVIDREERTRDLAEQLRLAQQRESLGRDVHDLLGHSLTVITVKTELARRMVERDPQRAIAELDEVLALSREAAGEVRQAVGGLHSPEWAAQLRAARTALDAAEIEARLPGPAGLPAEQQTLLAWCLREAVTNVIRHAQATVCTVEAGPGRLVVEDDGVGTDPGAGTGNGLRGMRERVRQAGGELILSAADASPDRPGTRLEVRLP